MKNKILLKKILVYFGLYILIISGYLLAKNKIKDTKVIARIQNSKVSVDYRVFSQLESIEIKKNKYVITGWGLALNAKQGAVNIALCPSDGSEQIILRGRRMVRDDINELYDTENVEGETGFTVSVDSKKLQSNVVYEVLLDISYDPMLVTEEAKKWDETQTKKISMKQYIYNGQIYDINPLLFEEPSIEDDAVKEIVSSGMLCSYISEFATWIYYYDQNLFFVIEASEKFDLTQRPSIPSGLYTHYEETVSVDDMDDYLKRGYILRECYLDESHFIKENDSTYLLLQIDLPKNCPLDFIHTGLYLNRTPQGFLFEEDLHLYRIIKADVE